MDWKVSVSFYQCDNSGSQLLCSWVGKWSAPRRILYLAAALNRSYTGNSVCKNWNCCVHLRLIQLERTGTGNRTCTIGNNGSWFLALYQTSVNISVQYFRTRCSWSCYLYLSRSRSCAVWISHFGLFCKNAFCTYVVWHVHEAAFCVYFSYKRPSLSWHWTFGSYS